MPIRVLSLGAGVQSTALLLMSIRGELPRLDHAIFADTQWEPREVYEHLDWLEKKSAAAGIPLHRVTSGSLRDAAMEVRTSKKSGKTYIRTGIPVFTRDATTATLGKGMRQCTRDYKIVPVDRKCREIRGESNVEVWIGITLDEAKRRKPSQRAWKTHCYPFLQLNTSNDVTSEPQTDCNYLDKYWTRVEVQKWLRLNYPDRVVPRSACIACPFRRNAEWRVMRDEQPEEFARAVADDELLREAYAKASAIRSVPFLHDSRVPLALADIDEDDGLLSFNQECEGMCGV